MIGRLTSDALSSKIPTRLTPLKQILDQQRAPRAQMLSNQKNIPVLTSIPSCSNFKILGISWPLLDPWWGGRPLSKDNSYWRSFLYSPPSDNILYGGRVFSWLSFFRLLIGIARHRWYVLKSGRVKDKAIPSHEGDMLYWLSCLYMWPYGISSFWRFPEFLRILF